MRQKTGSGHSCSIWPDHYGLRFCYSWYNVYFSCSKSWWDLHHDGLNWLILYSYFLHHMKHQYIKPSVWKVFIFYYEHGAHRRRRRFVTRLYFEIPVFICKDIYLWLYMHSFFRVSFWYVSIYKKPCFDIFILLNFSTASLKCISWNNVCFVLKTECDGEQRLQTADVRRCSGEDDLRVSVLLSHSFGGWCFLTDAPHDATLT